MMSLKIKQIKFKEAENIDLTRERVYECSKKEVQNISRHKISWFR